MKPKISVVIPSYNHERYIPKAVESVVAQTFTDWELIIIDDGSSDASWEYISGLSDPRIKAVKQENHGAHYTINRGLELAEGEYLTILNSDDEYVPSRFQIFVDYLEENPETACICSYIQIIDDNDKDLGIKEGWLNCEPWTVDHPELSYQKLNSFNANLLMGNFVATTSNIFMRRDAFSKIGGMRNFRFAHDWDFMLRLASAYRCEILPHALVRYRVHDTNTINTNRKWLLFENCLVIACNLDRLYETLFAECTPDLVVKQHSLLFHSMNFQGNDKMFWTLKAFLDAFRKQGVEAPEELLLENSQIREQIVDLIYTGPPEKAQEAQFSRPKLGKRQKLREIKRIILEQ